MTVTPIGKQGITPEVCLDHAHKALPKIKQLYMVYMDDSGQCNIACSGDLPGMALALQYLDNHIKKILQRRGVGQ